MPQPLALNHRFEPRRPVDRTAARDLFWRLAPLTLVFYSFLLLPPEASISLGGVYLPSYRIALLATALPAVAMLLRSRDVRWTLVDGAVAFIAFWILLSFSMSYGLGTGLVRGAGITVDTALPYLVARASIRSFRDLRYFLLLCLPGLVISAAILAVESVSGRLLVRPAFASIFGSGNAYNAGEAVGSLALRGEYRLGLLRAYGTFSHPILGGVMMASFLPLFYFSGLRSWPLYLGMFAALAAVFSLSSAAFLALIIAVGAITIFLVKPYFPKVSWWLIVFVLALIVWTLHMVSQNGIIAVIARLTLSPHTAGYRTLIWQFGSETVANHPWFGIGYQEWERLSWMGESVDAHFLMLAMRHGLAVPVALLVAILYGMVRLGLVFPRLTPVDQKFAIGLNVAMVIYLITAQTVSYFGSTNLVFMTMLALLCSVANPRPVHTGRQLVQSRPARYPMQPWQGIKRG